MKKLALALAALSLAAPAAAAGQDVAPAAKRKPAPTAPAAPQREQHYQAALTAAASQDGGDAALDASLIRGMSRLLAAGKCGEAAGLATRDGRKELASRAQQLCK
jgi:hypothetical protein